MSFMDEDSFTSSFIIFVSCNLFSCLIALSRIRSKMLNRSEESGLLALFTSWRGKLSVFLTKYDVSRGSYIDILYCVEEVPFRS